MSAEFNRIRSNQSYQSLNRNFWSRFIKDVKDLGKLVDLEIEVQGDIERMIKSPRDVALWRAFGFDG